MFRNVLVTLCMKSSPLCVCVCVFCGKSGLFSLRERNM